MAKEKDAIDHQIENFGYATWLIKIIAIIIAVGIFLISRYAFIFFTAAMLPALIILFFDRAVHKCASATICTFNLIGVLPYIGQLWRSNAINATAQNIIISPMTWILIYSAIFVGFIVYLAIPRLIAQIYIARANIKIRSLIEQRDKICNEWDIRIDNKKSSTEREFGI